MSAHLRADVQARFPHRCAGNGCSVCSWSRGERVPSQWNAQVTSARTKAEPCHCAWCRRQPTGFTFRFNS